jgi:hypothetical protein
MVLSEKDGNANDLRVIKTARDKASINEAARNGYRPLVKKVEPSDEIRTKFAVVQNKETGEIEVLGDLRREINEHDEYETTVIGWTYYYPYNFESPFAAYLIPKDIQVGERVFIEDLIEDYIGASWNQGDTYRLESCEAIWNGKDLEIQYDPDGNCTEFLG